MTTKGGKTPKQLNWLLYGKPEEQMQPRRGFSALEGLCTSLFFPLLACTALLKNLFGKLLEKHQC